MLQLPDSVLSAREVMNESVGLAHLLTGRSATVEKIATIAINQHLTLGLDRIQQDLVNELHLNLDEVLGQDTDNWKSVLLFPAMEKVITQIGTRVLLGLPLCRNEGYHRALLRCMHRFGMGMVVSAQLLPWFLQPILSIFFRIPLRLAFRVLSSYTEPLVTQWLARIEQEDKGKSLNTSEVLPYNLAVTFIRVARKILDHDNLNGRELTYHINQIVSVKYLSHSAAPF